MELKTEPALSLVVPCFNPPAGWLEVIEQELIELKKAGILPELILVNDGSIIPFPEDLELRLSALSPFVFISYPDNRGKGAALRAGVQSARGQLVIYTDVDFPYTTESFLNLYKHLKEGADVAIGVRPESYYNSLPASRVAVSKTLRLLIRFLLRIPTDDTQCGLKGFNQAGKEAFLKTTINRFLFDMEFIKIASACNLQIRLVEVHLKPGLRMASLPVKILFQESWNFVKLLFS